MTCSIRTKAMLFLLLLAGLGACAKDRDTLQNIPLAWRPTSSIGQADNLDLSGIAGARIHIERLRDIRREGQVIAENREEADKGRILPVTTRDNVAEFCTEQLRVILGQLGISVGRGGPSLGGEVRRFFVTETDNYRGEVMLHLTLHNRQGRLLWSGTVTGYAKRFGRSYQAENYYEVLSDALIDAAHNLVRDRGFRHAVRAG